MKINLTINALALFIIFLAIRRYSQDTVDLELTFSSCAKVKLSADDVNGVTIAIMTTGQPHISGLFVLAERDLQDILVLDTFSDHILGRNHDHNVAKKQMLASAFEKKKQFDFNNSNLIEAAADSTAAYTAHTNEINNSTPDNHFFLIDGTTSIQTKRDARENHRCWTWAETENTFIPNDLDAMHIAGKSEKGKL